MAYRGCSVDECTRPHAAFGWCGTHYAQWRRAGADEGTRTRVRVRPTCELDGCAKPHFGRGYCQMHYTRWRKTGNPHQVKKFIHDPDANFWLKVDNSGECWRWTGATDRGGYGSFRADSTSVGAHRWSYVRFVGPVADDLELDHLCHTVDPDCAGGTKCPHRRCVNPAHLEPVTPRENWSRSLAPSRLNADKTHCVYGHPFDEANTYWRPRGGRECRQCARERIARYQLRVATA